MKIISEKTGLEYATVAECLEAEKAFDEKRKREEAQKQALELERKAKMEAEAVARKEAADEVEAARQKMLAAQKEYRQVLAQFCQNFGAYHRTISSDDISNVLDEFLDWFGL